MRISLTIFVILLAFTPKLLAQVSSLADAQSRSSQTLAEWTKDFTVTTVPKYGVPTCLLTFKPEAIPVFQTNSNNCGTYGVAVFVGQGRIAAFGHNGYWFSDAILKRNVVNWAGQGQISDAQVLSLQNINQDSFLTRDLSAYKVLVWPGTPEYKSSEALDKLESFVRNGGGLISAYAGWVWTAYGGFSNELEVSTNKFLMRFGVLNTVNYLSGSNQGLSYAPVIENINSLYAFRAGLTNSDRVSAFSQALERLPIEVFNGVSDFNDFMNTGDENLSFPILKGNDQSKYRAVYLTKKYSNVNTPKALSGISSVPGVVSSAQRLTVEVTVSREVSDSWLSTGYYLAAGEVLTITAKTPIQNWHVRIGCHSDSINHKDNWPRYPSITRQEKLSATVHRITSPFGGLIYLVSSGSSCTSITVELSNVVRAAFYDVNNPAANNWDLNAAAPMAEIQGLYLTMSVPLSGIQRVSNPQAVADYYDKVIAEMHRVRSTIPGRRERFVGDIEISAGWMHSGYPIMTYLSIVTSTTGVPLQMDVEGVLKSGSWGHFHEIGHNLQRGWWTIDGAGEVTNNIFSLLGGYICCNIPVLENSWIKGKYNSTLIKLNDYINRTTTDTYNWLKSDPGIFLVQYALLIHEFGWETYRLTFAAYESSTGPRPSSNQDKIDVWIRELSRAAQRNLLPYFELWRMPISDAGISGVNALGLSPWLPNYSVFPYKNINADYFNSIKSKYGL